MGKINQIRSRAVSALLTAVFCAGMLLLFPMHPMQVSAAGGNCGSAAQWDVSGDTLTISGSGSVTSTGWKSYLSSLKKVVIQNGITSMPANSFDGCETLQSLVMADTLTTLGTYFCSNCTALSSVRFSSSLTKIPNYGFYNCSSLPELDLPDSLESIGTSAFYGALSLHELTIPDRVTTVMGGAFFGTNIESLTLGSSLKTIGKKAFAPACFSSVVIPDSVESIGEGAIGMCYDSVRASGTSYIGRSESTPIVTTLYGKSGSVAQSYAKSAKLKFVATDVTVHVHTWSAWETQKEAGCETDGVMIRRCSCGESETKTIAATGHSWGSWTTRKDATCTEDGISVRSCRNCQEEETRTISATGHSWSTWTTRRAASCTEDGESVRTCKNCQEEETKAIAATGHHFGAPIYRWSSDNNDCTAERICTNDGYEESESVRTDYRVTKQPGVGTAGEGVYTASFDNKAFDDQKKVVEIPAVDAKWSAPEYSWSNDHRSCTATRREANSGKTESETVKAVYSVAAKASCLHAGKGVYTAAFRNTAFSEQSVTVEIPATGHDWGAWTEDIPAGCESDGRSIRTCKNCGESEYQLTDPTGHHFGDWKTEHEPGCDKAGERIRVCSGCGKTESESIPAKGHAWGEWSVTKAPTIDREGEETRVCANCGQKQTQSVAVLTSFVISVSANAGGTVSPEGEYRVAEGESARISFTPANGYRTASVLVDGNAVSFGSSISIPDVHANHTVSVVFQEIAPQVTRSCIAISAAPKRTVWLRDEKSFSMNDFTVKAIISENGQTKEADITNDCYTYTTPAGSADNADRYGLGNVVFFYRGSDKEIVDYISRHRVNCQIPVYLRGDADMNGKVDAVDSMLALKNYVEHMAGNAVEVLNEMQKYITDVDSSGNAELFDATYILRFYTKSFAGLDPEWKDAFD